MSRLLTLLLLYRCGYFVGKYISLEMMIEKTEDSYYDALQASSQNWPEKRKEKRPVSRRSSRTGIEPFKIASKNL